MALTEAQRVQVRLFMGWSARFFQFDSELEQAMNSLDANPDTEAVIVTLIGECQRIDTAIVAAEGRFRADAVGSITLTQGRELELLRSRGRQFSGRIASVLGVPIRHDVWSGTGPKMTASRYGMVPGASNMQLHG